MHLESDRLQEWIVSGGVWPDQEPKAEAERQLHLRTRNICLLADSYFEAGFTPVIDDVVIGSRLAEFRRTLRSQHILLLLLTPSLQVVEKRDAGRPEKHVFGIWSHLDDTMRRETPRVWLDTSEMTQSRR